MPEIPAVLVVRLARLLTVSCDMPHFITIVTQWWRMIQIIPQCLVVFFLILAPIPSPSGLNHKQFINRYANADNARQSSIRWVFTL